MQSRSSSMSSLDAEDDSLMGEKNRIKVIVISYFMTTDNVEIAYQYTLKNIHKLTK